jgi:hypothetical protein
MRARDLDATLAFLALYGAAMTYSTIRPTAHLCPDCGSLVLAPIVVSDHQYGPPTEHHGGGFMCSDPSCGWETSDSTRFERD